ncbi:MAG: UDP-N-acetylglucosamine 1-carboxyvinyltransferase [Oscillospiraceae bacterium]|nr:UDP-N-acetylglucosamine 1-carboxyvinyltransferase [Oscillospiraceae bacterium]MCI1991158.1 UDP-N-acetylglucosamine 1-carboxyvinyltransferase [Oscillospiraceae bacterium]MCI2035711.1 UDP-N-acetylglucosamine 1-carboxyvinyltransferase [Oscillospiraceae bacterium]
MDKFVIKGGKRLTGEVVISGAKNAAVAIIPATILSEGICRIENVPNITDVNAITRILYDMGAKVRNINRSTLEIDASTIRTYVASEELARHMRGSYYLMGALLGRFHHAVVTMPGGCDFGVRPIDQHLKGFAALGAKHRIEAGMVDVSAERLVGNNIYLDVASVGATINIMLAAVKAEGTTVIENAAKEPHIVDLANFLNSMGADIRGAGTDVIKIFGVQHLSGTTYSIIPDQIEAGTYMVAAAATGGDVMVKNIIPKHLESVSAKLEEMGVTLEEFDDSIRVSRSGTLTKCNIKTMPHPGFPTDMQPQIAVLLSLAEGTSIINESVWDNRFRYVEELKRMGAQISVDGKLAVVEGVDHLDAAPVKATDLRAGAAVVIAALCARGVTQIENIEQIERGYEDIEKKLQRLGADIRRVPVLEPKTAQAI